MAEGFQNTGSVLAEAGNKAMERVDAANAETEPEQTSETAETQETQETASEQGATVEGQPEAEGQQAQQETQAAPYWQGDLDGESISLEREHVDQAVSAWLRALKNLNSQQGQVLPEQRIQAPGQPTPQQEQVEQLSPEAQKILDSYTQPLRSQIAELQGKLQQQEQKAHVEDVMRQSEQAMAKHDVFKKAASNPRIANMFRSQVFVQKYMNPNMSFDAAAKNVADSFQELLRQENTQYVQSKVLQAQTKVEGKGGASPAPGEKKLTAKDLWNGTVLERALKRVTSGV